MAETRPPGRLIGSDPITHSWILPDLRHDSDRLGLVRLGVDLGDRAAEPMAQDGLGQVDAELLAEERRGVMPQAIWCPVVNLGGLAGPGE